ncbi:MAG: DUF2249 domain-containing protein [Halobacteriales archaeon]
MSSNIDATATRTLDAREVEGEPFGEIMTILDELEGNETLLLINGFEPEPLYEVLDDRGFTYETTQVESNEWHVRIEPA